LQTGYFKHRNIETSKTIVGETLNTDDSEAVTTATYCNGASKVEKDDLSGLPLEMLIFPRHIHDGINEILSHTEQNLINMHHDSKVVDPTSTKRTMSPIINSNDSIFANTYVDLGNLDTVGFDYDHTLIHYTDELLTLLYEMALLRLVEDRHYPVEMMECGLHYDPYFSIRGLAVDKKTGWVCHLAYTHKVAVAWEGREKVKTSRIFEEYRGKRALNPKERRARLKPLNDLFSMYVLAAHQNQGVRISQYHRITFGFSRLYI
jgi:hypothetical protein